jgi:hypothetical protein
MIYKQNASEVSLYIQNEHPVFYKQNSTISLRRTYHINIKLP